MIQLSEDSVHKVHGHSTLKLWSSFCDSSFLQVQVFDPLFDCAHTTTGKKGTTNSWQGMFSPIGWPMLFQQLKAWEERVTGCSGQSMESARLHLTQPPPQKKEGAGCTFFHPASQWITCWSKNNRKHLSIWDPLTSNNCVILPAKSISHLETGIQGHPNPSKNALCKPGAFACILRQVCHNNVINAWAAMEMLYEWWPSRAKPKRTIMGDQVKPEEDEKESGWSLWLFDSHSFLPGLIFHRKDLGQNQHFINWFLIPRCVKIRSAFHKHPMVTSCHIGICRRAFCSREASRSFPNWEAIYFFS